MLAALLGMLALGGFGGYILGDRVGGETVVEEQHVTNQGLLSGIFGGDNNMLPVLLLVMMLQSGQGFSGGGTASSTPVYVNVVDDDDN
jgi:hypothetical protein